MDCAIQLSKVFGDMIQPSVCCSMSFASSRHFHPLVLDVDVADWQAHYWYNLAADGFWSV
jgi:hypothetical protein